MSKKSGLTKRQKLIIEMLAAFNADDPITIQAISEKLKLSSRTVLREMPRINEWFEENDFKLVKKPRIGMYVDEDTETRNYIKELVDMDENKPVYSKADRQMIILLELLTINEPLKYFYFTSLFHISDATLSNDLEEVETWLDHYNLTLYRRPGMGIYWEGKEEDYRQAVTMVLRQKLRGHSLKVLFDEEKKLKERMFPNLTQEVLDGAARCSLSVSEYCRSLSLGGRPRERYTEEERQLLRDIAQLKGTLQRLNNYFGGRQYREVFEENRALITELKKILSR